MLTELIARAKRGDAEAFREVTDRYRRELEVHCYRILGSLQDAEDAMQEVMLAAWRGLDRFEERSSIRTWLYRIATNRCLNALRADRTQMQSSLAGLELPEPTCFGDVPWLEPYPDERLADLADDAARPDARYEAREAISLAFITALQVLPPRQRIALILRDVLGYRAAEAAEILGSTEESVTSALKRARATIQVRAADAKSRPPVTSELESAIVSKLAAAFEIGDVHALVRMLADGVVFTMPPLPFEYHGRESAALFLSVVAARPGRPYRLRWTRANGQPAFAAYVRAAHDDVYHAMGLLVLTLSAQGISAITRFENGVLARFGLPQSFTG